MTYLVIDHCDGDVYEPLLQKGWRRHGIHFFRPDCPNCTACRSLRVDVNTFRPSKSQRKARNRNADVSLTVVRPTVSPQHVELYNAWHADMHLRRGWRWEATDEEDYAATFLAGAFEFAREFQYYRDGKLIGVGLVDVLPTALSSAYFYHDPAWRPLAPGVFSVLQEIQWAQQQGKRWLYLGYWIEQCGSMAYKAQFRPHQLLSEPTQTNPEPDDWKTNPKENLPATDTR